MDIKTTGDSRRGKAILTLLGSALSNQTGAALGSFAFPAIGPAGVVAVRQLVAAAVLLPIVRPPLGSFTWRQWWPVILLALVFGTMNLSLYFAIDRVGLGLAVTLEFLGPLAVALLNSRGRLSAACAGAAGLGVLAITHPQLSTDYLGVGLALGAAGCWAAYILLNRTVGRRIPGLNGTAAAAGLSAAVFLPIGILVYVQRDPAFSAIVCAVAAGVLASAVPYIADLITLRHLPPHIFGVLMSVNPIFAATIGAVVLGEGLGILEWSGIIVIVAANACALAIPDARPKLPPRRLRTSHRPIQESARVVSSKPSS